MTLVRLPPDQFQDGCQSWLLHLHTAPLPSIRKRSCSLVFGVGGAVRQPLDRCPPSPTVASIWKKAKLPFYQPVFLLTFSAEPLDLASVILYTLTPRLLCLHLLTYDALLTFSTHSACSLRPSSKITFFEIFSDFAENYPFFRHLKAFWDTVLGTSYFKFICLIG